ncbi:MAG: chemotaxis protein CheA [Limnobacter sp.]|nr:chemotaxis protein CheA [Limnobacter sp.]
MKALQAQFISEGRELLDSIGAAMLQFEKSPDDFDNLNNLFRHVHTLKGNCGLFEQFRPIGMVLHAAEDTLDAVREGTRALKATDSDLLLSAMDLVSMALDDWEADRYTEATYAEHASSLANSIRQLDSKQEINEVVHTLVGTTAVSTNAGLPDWVERILLEVEPHDALLQCVLYKPEAECFFKGEDPFQIGISVPNLQVIEIEKLGSWLDPVGFDVYTAQIQLLIASSASASEVLQIFECIPEQIQLIEVAAALGRKGVAEQRSQNDTSLTINRSVDSQSIQESNKLAPILATLLPQARRVWAAQTRMLELTEGQPGWAGRCNAACAAISGLSKALGRPQWAEAAEHVTQVSLAEGQTGPLLEWLRRPPIDLLETSQRPEDSLVPVGSVSEVLAPVNLPAVKVGLNAPGITNDSESKTSSTLKVSKEKVDRLMELIGEMVVAKNALPYLADRAEQQFKCRELSRELKGHYSVINRIAEEMQDAIMQVRMLPVGHVFQRFPRLVRDLSKKLGKKVRLEITGEDTEADKNMIEALSEPLIHLLRNSLDHGIEPPEDRLAANKDVEGVISIHAWQEGDRVHIRIQDDGAGIDAEVVRRKALEKQLLSEEKLSLMSSQELQQLIFLPGFSTAAAISDVSGRGVGMDVVRSAISKSNGQLDLTSTKGQGTSIVLSLPLTMAVTNVMMISAAGQHFGIPMDVVVETVRVHQSAIHQIQTQRATVLRGKIIPLVSLGGLLQLGGAEITNDDQEYAVLVVRLGQESVGILVDDFDSTVEILLRPLEGVLADMHQYCGSALLGDGTVLLILNLLEVMECQSH